MFYSFSRTSGAHTLFDLESDEFNVGTAKMVEEASKLLEVGFEYVFNLDDVKLFRKRR